MVRARPSRAHSLGACVAQLLLVTALLLGSLELHPAGEPLRETTGTWTVQPQEPGCAGPGTKHVDRGGSADERQCPSCLNRLQSRGNGLPAAPAVEPLLPSARAGAPASRGEGLGERHALAARGPPSIPS